MANPGSFGDLGKEAKETLLRGKDFVSKPHIEIVTTSSNNVKSTAKITREDSGSLLGSIELKFPKTNGVESSVTLDSANKLKATVSLADKIASGLKASLTTEIDATKNEKVFKGGYEYKRPHLTLAATLNFPWKREVKDPEKEGPSVTASAVLGHDKYGVSGGAEAEFAVNTSTLKSANVTLLYRTGGFALTAFSRSTGGRKPGFICGGTFYSKLKLDALSNAEAAGEVAVDTKAEKDQVTITLGGAFDTSKDSRVAATLDTRGRLVAQLTHRLNPSTRLKIGTEAYPLAADKPPRFFAGLSFTD